MPTENVHTEDSAAGTAIVLERGAQRVVLDAHGAALRSWSVGGEEKLSWHGPGDPDRVFDGATLVPWPNRIRDGRYRRGGAIHQLAITEPQRGTALHGLATEVEWDVVAASDPVRFRRSIGPAEGYPYRLVVEVVYALTAGGVAVELTAINHGDEHAPFGAGSHPYLTLPHGTGHAALEVPAATYVPVDDRMLPTGPPAPVDAAGLDFRERRALDSLALDTCFGDLRRDAGLARLRIWPDDDAAPITLWCDEGFAFVHVYLAAALGRLAVEPSTCAPDAFNTGVGLRSLAPGDRFAARWGLCVAH